MGNRAVIEFENTGTGVYLHWNGGKDSIDPLLAVAKEYGIPTSENPPADLVQVIKNTFDNQMTIEFNSIDQLDCDNFDNGVYVIDLNFNIVDRKYNKHPEQNEYDFDGFVEFVKSKNDKYFIDGKKQPDWR